MYFQGTLTQHEACHDPHNPNGTQYCITYRLDNLPNEGWNQLWNALNGDPDTQQAYLFWSSDISWDMSK